MRKESIKRQNRLLTNDSYYITTYASTLFLVLSMLTVLSATFGTYGYEVYTASYYESQIGLFLRMNESFSTWPSTWHNTTLLGDALVYLSLLSVLFVRWPQLWAALISAIPLTGALSIFGKHMFSMPRPAAVLSHDQFNIVGPILSANTSLPSGHTMTAFAITTVVVLFFLSTVKTKSTAYSIVITGLFVATSIGVSRVAVGAHWPFDVVLGAVLGSVGGISGILLARYFAGRWKRISLPIMQLAFGLVFLLCSVVLFTQSGSDYGVATVMPYIAALFALVTGTHLLLSHLPTMPIQYK